MEGETLGEIQGGKFKNKKQSDYIWVLIYICTTTTTTTSNNNNNNNNNNTSMVREHTYPRKRGREWRSQTAVGFYNPKWSRNDDDDNDGDEDDDTKGNKPAGIQDFYVLLSLSKHY